MSYQDVKDKLYHGHRRIANNTYLTLEYDWDGRENIVMRLHGHYIAVFFPDYIQFSSAGWHTRTTRNRLNLALDLAGIMGYSVWQHNYTWYYGYLLSGIKFYDGMKIDYTGKVLT